MFLEYHEIELKVFRGIKRDFERIEPLASDEHANAFYDLVAQYCGGGQDYIAMEDIYQQTIESFALERLNSLPVTEKNDLTEFYEANILENSFDPLSNQYVYTTDLLCSELAGRFKMWIDDNFSIDDLLEADEEESDEDDDEDSDEEEDDSDIEENKDIVNEENPEEGNDSSISKK